MLAEVRARGGGCATCCCQRSSAAMCLFPSVSPPNEISSYWSDEELCIRLHAMINGSPPPDNVTVDVNPYQHKPSNLPDGLWYLTTSEDTKCGDGFWNPKGETCVIFRNSSITGWRTTLEFYEGITPHALKTDWVMQQYKITQKAQSQDIEPMASTSLCRIFQSRGQSSNHEMQKTLADANVAVGNPIRSGTSVISNTNNSTGQGSKSQSQVKQGNHETGPLASSGRTLNHPDNLPEIDCFFTGDYLELNDLADLISPSSSSDNSSCLSQTSDEYFDSLALLQDLESDKDVGSKFIVAASLPDKVVLRPASSGSLTCDDSRKFPPEEPPKTDGYLLGSTKLPDKKGMKRTIANQDADNKVEVPSSSPRNLVAASGSNKAASSNGKGKAAADRKKKPKKKYLCFMPF